MVLYQMFMPMDYMADIGIRELFVYLAQYCYLLVKEYFYNSQVLTPWILFPVIITKHINVHKIFVHHIVSTNHSFNNIALYNEYSIYEILVSYIRCSCFSSYIYCQCYSRKSSPLVKAIYVADIFASYCNYQSTY